MSWNYRVAENLSTGCFDIIEVYYDKDGKIEGYCKAGVDEWQKIEDLEGTFNLMLEAFQKPNVVLRSDGTLEEK